MPTPRGRRAGSNPDDRLPVLPAVPSIGRRATADAPESGLLRQPSVDPADLVDEAQPERVLQVEALAQTMAVYVAQQEGFGDRIGLFAAIDDCRFKRVVQPGDRLTLEVTMDKLGGRFGRGHAVAKVDGEVACEANLSFIIPREGALG